MRRATSMLLTVISVTILGGGCASHKQWSDWERHPTHFASQDHMWFSVTHQTQKTPPGVARQDLDNARGQVWWGDKVAVRQSELSRR